MKSFFGIAVLFLSINAFAGSGLEAVKIVLEQDEVLKLEEKMSAQGFTLSNVQDVYATRGIFPRCPCTKLNLTYSRGMLGSGAETKKVFSVDASGFGTTLNVSISEAK